MIFAGVKNGLTLSREQWVSVYVCLTAYAACKQRFLHEVSLIFCNPPRLFIGRKMCTWSVDCKFKWFTQESSFACLALL